jgi:hypothetical protein
MVEGDVDLRTYAPAAIAARTTTMMIAAFARVIALDDKIFLLLQGGSAEPAELNRLVMRFYIISHDNDNSTLHRNARRYAILCTAFPRHLASG